MTNKHKVLDFIDKNLKNLEGNWRDGLESLNIWEEVSTLYYHTTDHVKAIKITELEANTALAFIVKSYDMHSLWLEPHKDRFDNKVKIITRLAGPAALTNSFYNEMVYCQDEACNDVIDWYINYQRDSRWNKIISNKEFASQATALARSGMGNAKGGVDIGNMLKIADDRDVAADKLWDILRTEFLNLDKILEKEKKPEATSMEPTNFMSHEGYIRARMKKELDAMGFGIQDAPPEG